MKKFRSALLISSLTILILLSNHVSKLSAGETIDIGVLLPLTGHQETIGMIEKQTFELAAEKFNQDGGLNGQQINLIFIDSAANPVRAVNAVRQVLAENGGKLLMLTGGCSSAASWAVAEYAQQQKIPFLINTASSSRITGQQWDYVFRLNPPEEEYLLQPLARYLKDDEEYQSVAIIYENSICMTETARKLKELCGRLKLDLSIWSSYHPGRKNFRRLGTQLTEKQPDILLLVSNQNEAISILSQCRKMEIPPELIVGCSPTFSRQEMWDTAGKILEGVKSVILWQDFLPYDGIDEFSREYSLYFSKSPDYHEAEAYAALEIIAEIFSRAQTFSREEIKNLLAATEMMTVFGPVRFVSDSRYTNQNRLSGHLVQWHQGFLELVDN
ncbi:MAG: ABC transporter substrate-binding protein [Pseudomonadota bacterium]|nr:ABC transporter substrate-binding protein [Pseudomonadota bacterium]